MGAVSALVAKSWRGAQPPIRAGLGLASLLAIIASALALALGATPAAAAPCPNEAIRIEQGAAALALPDCRAYELVSPGSTPSLTTDGLVETGGLASPNGDALSYFSRYSAQSSALSSEWWRSTRGATGWAIEAAAPQDTTMPSYDLRCTPGVAFSEDLGASVLADGWNQALDTTREQGACGHPLEELVAGEPRGYGNLYLRRTPTVPYQLLNSPPPGAAPANAQFQDASIDFSHIVFGEEAQLTPEAPAGYNLYEWVDGTVRLLGVLPSGAPVPAVLAAGTSHPALPPGREFEFDGGTETGAASFMHAVSDDGERVLFYAEDSLYLRQNAGRPPAASTDCRAGEPGLACTLQIDASRGLGPSGGGELQYASADGGRVFFTDESKLTRLSSAEPNKPDLYEYDVAGGELTDITAVGGEAANVRGFSGASADGSHLYFVARGVLTGAQANAQGETAQAKEPNLYLARDGALTYVATLSPWLGSEGSIDGGDWWEVTVRGGEDKAAPFKTSWSPGGRFLSFLSYKPLTGFDNSPAAPKDCKGKLSVLAYEGAPCLELFLYDAVTGQLRCLSCDPAGSRPTGTTYMIARQQFGHYAGGPAYIPRMVGDLGQVFFQTPNALVSGDTNGVLDVYEYVAGQVHLISTGTAQGASSFYDASADGKDIFFSTPQALVGADQDGGLSIYDAHADGGFPEPPPPPAPCVGEQGCRGAGTSPPAAAAPATGFFSGAGNLKGQGRRNCSRFGHRAKTLSHRAKKLRRKARRAHAHGHPAGQMQRKAKRLTRQAEHAGRNAEQCRRANQSGGKRRHRDGENQKGAQ